MDQTKALRDSEIAKIEARFDRAHDILMEQYDSHMKAILPKPELLPIRVNLFIQKSDGTKQEVHGMFQVKPYETIDCLIENLKDFYASK